MSEPMHRDRPATLSIFHSGRAPAAGPLGGLVSIAGALISLLAVTAAMALALVFAATLVVVLMVAGALLSLTAFAWRTRRKPAPAGVVLSARKVGHRWVAYGWDDARS